MIRDLDRAAWRRGLFTLGALAAAAIVGCSTARRDERRTSSELVRVTPPVGEETLQPLPKPRIDITELHEIDPGDPGYEAVSGTIVNSGDKDSSTLEVQVLALDSQGRIVGRATGVPDSGVLRAGGGTTRFTATFVKRPEIDKFKVEAVAR